MSNCIFLCLLPLASEMFSLPLPMQKSSTSLRRRGYSCVHALQPVRLLEKICISSSNKPTTLSYHFSEGGTLLTRFGLQQRCVLIFLKKIKNLLEIALFSKSFSVLDAIHHIFDVTIVLILKAIRLPRLLIFQDSSLYQVQVIC